MDARDHHLAARPGALPSFAPSATVTGADARAASSSPRVSRAWRWFGHEISPRTVFALVFAASTILLFCVHHEVSAKMRVPPRAGPIAHVVLLGPMPELRFSAREAYRVHVPGKIFPEVVATGEPMPLVATLAADTISLNDVVIGGGPVRLEGMRSDAFALGRSIVSSVLVVRRSERGGLELIAELPLEVYVARVLFGEMPKNFHEEALKAQLVAARSYAYAALQAGRTLFADDRSQVYLGKGVLEGRADALARATCGEVLVQGDTVMNAYYHSTCGGHTLRASAVFGGSADADPTVDRECPYCRHSPRFQWQVPLQPAALAQTFGVASAAITALDLDGEQKRMTLTTASGRSSLTWDQFRRHYNGAMQASVLHSARFVELQGGVDAPVLVGRGFGHGVGLCQFGADGMAKTGASYREILSFYYPNAEGRTRW